MIQYFQLFFCMNLKFQKSRLDVTSESFWAAVFVHTHTLTVREPEMINNRFRQPPRLSRVLMQIQFSFCSDSDISWILGLRLILLGPAVCFKVPVLL